MLEVLKAIALGIIQGLTEFLPVSQLRSLENFLGSAAFSGQQHCL